MLDDMLMFSPAFLTCFSDESFSLRHLCLPIACSNILSDSGTWISDQQQLTECLFMDNNRYIKILCWNIRGINSQEKWDAIRDKISESACHVVCLQETKRASFDPFYLKKFYPRSIDKFAFSPSDGASGGLLIAWNSSLLDGTIVHFNSYAVSCKLTFKLDNRSFHVTNIYGPSDHAQKQGFVT